MSLWYAQGVRQAYVADARTLRQSLSLSPRFGHQSNDMTATARSPQSECLISVCVRVLVSARACMRVSAHTTHMHASSVGSSGVHLSEA